MQSVHDELSSDAKTSKHNKLCSSVDKSAVAESRTEVNDSRRPEPMGNRGTSEQVKLCIGKLGPVQDEQQADGLASARDGPKRNTVKPCRAHALGSSDGSGDEGLGTSRTVPEREKLCGEKDAPAEATSGSSGSGPESARPRGKNAGPARLKLCMDGKAPRWAELRAEGEESAWTRLRASGALPRFAQSNAATDTSKLALEGADEKKPGLACRRKAGDGPV